MFLALRMRFLVPMIVLVGSSLVLPMVARKATAGNEGLAGLEPGDTTDRFFFDEVQERPARW